MTAFLAAGLLASSAASSATLSECAQCQRHYLEAMSGCLLAEADSSSCADSAGRSLADCSVSSCPGGSPLPFEGQAHWSFIVDGEERCRLFEVSVVNPDPEQLYFANWINGALPDGSAEDVFGLEGVGIRMNGQEGDDPPVPDGFYSVAGGWQGPLEPDTNHITLNLCRQDNSPVGFFTLMFMVHSSP
jgi:hypothetical protein